MDRFAVLQPPQDPKNKPKLKTIFEDDGLLIEKARAFLQLHQEWLDRKRAGKIEPQLFPEFIAEKLEISIDDAKELPEFALTQLGEFERDYIQSQPHSSINLSGNTIQKPFDLFGVGEL
jgi:hypothetical protein